MKRWIVFSTIFLAAGLIHADEAVLSQLQNYRPYRVPPLNANYRAITLPTDKNINDRCRDGFIRDDGTYGPYGEMIKKEITGQGKSEARPEMFFDEAPAHIEDVCRDFKNFDADTKLNFWIYVMAAVSNNESGCDSKIRNNKAGPRGDGIAVGLFQTPALEGGKTPDWRGNGCKKPPPYDSPESQVACAMEITSDLLDGNLCGLKKSQYTCFDDDSYWATMRPNNKEQGAKLKNGTDSISIIKGFPACHN